MAINLSGINLTGRTSMKKAGDIDPYFSQVKFLASFNEDFIDVKGHVNTLVVNGDTSPAPGFSTSIKKFGSASVSMPTGQVNYQSNDFIPGTGDFTLEGWINPSDNTSCSPMGIGTGYGGNDVGAYSGAMSFLRFDNSAYGMNFLKPGGSGFGHSVPVLSGVWTFLSASRVSGVLYFGVGGVVESTTFTDNVFGNWLIIGHHGVSPANTSYKWKGQVDEVRLTIGVGRYTTNYTPPIAPFPT